MKQHKAPLVKATWVGITLLVLGTAFMQAMPEKVNKSDSSDPTGLVMAQLQAEYLLGVADLLDSTEEIAAQAFLLDVGTVGQRQRYMAFMIALGDPEGAKASALKMHVELKEANLELTEQESKTQDTLNQLADGSPSPSDSQSLQEELGWFGTLVEADAQQRQVLNSAAGKKVLYAGSIFLCIVVASIAGFIGLLVFIVRVINCKVHTGMVQGETRHGIYAEVFAIWLLLFFGLMLGAGVLGAAISKDNTTIAMLFSLVAFFASLSALSWARYRGNSWLQIRTDIGWTSGAGFFKELLFGIAGYAMMLPFLCIGIFLTLLLMLIQGTLAGGTGGDAFGGTGGGAHPIVLEIANGDLQLRILLVVLAAIAAPIVEETMFRGVLYRQLRTSMKRFGFALNVAISMLLTSFIFAAIHPQGWVAIPALMGIAVGMNMMREWRGSLIPSMVVHSMSNGIVTSMMLIFFS